MLRAFEQKIARFAEAHKLFDQASRILVAVSGGADSTALLYALAELKAAGRLSAELICGHVNHQLRARQAELDELFVAESAHRLGIESVATRVDVRRIAAERKLSIETAARIGRLAALGELSRQNHCQIVATAHHMNDNAETILHRLARGTAWRGLAGIRPARTLQGCVRFASPLLCVERTEILQYLRDRQIRWRCDPMNFDCSYRRNFIRHHLLPALQSQARGPLVRQLCQLAESARRFCEQIESFTDQIWPELVVEHPERICINLELLNQQVQPVKVELLRRGLLHLGAGLGELTQRHFERMLELAQASESGKSLILPARFRVRREYESLVIERPQTPRPAPRQPEEPIQLEVPGQTSYGDFRIDACVFDASAESLGQVKRNRGSSVEWFDFEAIEPPLVVRRRQPGDRFRPLGMPKEKKLGKFLTAAHVQPEVREQILLIADRKQILWVWPVRISDSCKVTNETKKILQLTIIPPKNS